MIKKKRQAADIRCENMVYPQTFLCGVKESSGGSPLYFAMHIFQNETFQALFGVNNQTEKEEKRMTAYFKTVIMRALKRQSTLLRK